MTTLKKPRTKFEAKQLKRMTAIGAVGPTNALIWVRPDLPGEVSVKIHPKGRPKDGQVYPLLSHP